MDAVGRLPVDAGSMRILWAGAAPSAPALGDAVPGLERRHRGWRLALAGGIAGMLSNSALHPLDTVKTVRQADPSRFRGVLATAESIVRTRGVAALYAGIGPALIGSALSSALYFGTYELMKRRISDAAARAGAAPGKVLARRAPVHALAAVSGNVASSVLFVPKEVVKQRMQAGVDAGPFFSAAWKLARTAGFPGLYAGYKSTLLRNIPSTVLRFVLYEEARRVIVRRRARAAQTVNNATGRSARAPAAGGVETALKTWEFLAAGALAGALASGFTTPMDVVKTRLSTGRIPAGTSIGAAMRQIVRQHGVQGLYVGIRPRIMWAALGTGIGFGSYELCKALLLGEESFRPLAVVSQHLASARKGIRSARAPAIGGTL